MSFDRELARRVVDFMNGLLEVDRLAVAALVDVRVPCNGALVKHPTVQVKLSDAGPRVGLLGILNGLCGADGVTSAIMMLLDAGSGERPDLIKFQVWEREPFGSIV